MAGLPAPFRDRPTSRIDRMLRSHKEGRQLGLRMKDAESATPGHLVPGRTCGTCMMCCKVPAIEEFAKPPGVWCRHAVSGKGCNIYADRPGSCRAFYCLWMQDASFGPEWKPEKAKFVVYVQRNGVNLQVAVDPSFPNAWTRPPMKRGSGNGWPTAPSTVVSCSCASAPE